jgi:ribosomal protein S17E
MGSIKNMDVKKTSTILVSKYGDKFGIIFKENKEAIREMDIVEDKRVLNQLAGSVTRMKKIRIRRGY